ncbi:putative ABC transport system permease protein [Jiangella mangrovi]|uniref:Putative ABC transport system permease protein n=2 Tax=Jiangella mangrovi TaxID=1524084 RepID=A0A7W9GQF9_9ACTN|nr:putative ABC transport system permease protein [Jiangella mangrovi]
MVIMRDIARKTIKGRKAGFVGAFLAVLLASTLVTALGVLVESGVRGGLPPQRYAGADVVVGGVQALPVVEDTDLPLSERVRLPADAVDAVAAVPGVAEAAGDVSAPVSVVTDGAVAELPRPVTGHGWSAAALTPFTVADGGSAPERDDEVALEDDLASTLGSGIGDRVELAVGGVASSYTVTAVVTRPAGADARESAVFLTDERAGDLAGADGRWDAVGVVAADGVAADDLAARIADAVPGVRTHTGDARGHVEFFDIGRARSELTFLALSLAGTTVLIAMFVVASTLALSIQQRRREFALLRAVGAKRGQVRRLVGAEVMLLASTAAVLGAVPGYLVAVLLVRGFAGSGLLPADFRLAMSPVPGLAAVVLCLVTARLAGWVAARRPARLNPVEALGESAVEQPRLGTGRVVAGVVLILLGLAASGIPMLVPGTVAVAGAAGGALLLSIGVALLGPRVLGAAAGLLAAPVRRLSPVHGYLATANMRANSRRLAAAVTPIVLAVAVVSVQLFSQSTLAAAAGRQTVDGVVADHVVTGSDGGVGAAVTDELRRELGGDVTVTPVVHSQVVVRYTELGDPAQETFAAQGLDAAGLDRTLDLEVRDGDLGDLRDGTVALSRNASATFGASVGETVEIVLGDGTTIEPAVVAVYGRGLGFGDLTLPHDQLAAHTTTGQDSWVLIGGGDTDAVGDAVARVAAEHPGLVAGTGAGLSAAGSAERSAESSTSLVAILALLAYLAVSVVNTLVMATSERTREFALLRLAGAGRRHVLAMMRVEAAVIVAVSVVVGLLVALPPLVGISVGLTESFLPSISPAGFLGIVLATASLGFLAVGVPARAALRLRPVDAIGLRE